MTSRRGANHAEAQLCYVRRVKWAIYILVFIWLFCGMVGAWMLGDLDRQHWKTIARGPITLAKAVNEDPARVPGLGT